MTLADLETLTRKTVGGLIVEQVADQGAYFNILVYGDPGVGKTVLAGSASAVEGLAPVLFIDVEGGTMSLAQTYPDVDVVRVKTWDDMQKVYDELHRGSKYKTVVLDSLTEIQKFSMYNILADLLKTDSDRDPDVAGMREWQKNIEQIRRLVRAFRDLGNINVIFTALAMQAQDSRSGLTMTKPSLQGKVVNEVPALVDIVLYYYIKRVDGIDQRLLLTTATDTKIAKDRSGLLPQVVENPTMQTLVNLMNGETE